MDKAPLVERLRAVTEGDAYERPWTFATTCFEAADRISALEEGRKGTVSSRSQPSGEASSSEEVFAGLDPAVSAAMDANFWKAEWHKLDAIRDDLLEALQETWRVLRAAGTLNLSNGVQLGQTAWYVKISDAEKLADAALAKATGLPVQPPLDNRKWGNPDVA